MRGEDLRRMRSDAHADGNTPTCVGKTHRRGCTSATPQKHPHMRGEDHRNWTGGSLEWETPPHAWGRHRHALHHSASGGNTPTCVGKTLPWTGSRTTQGKHPHMRGEDNGNISPNNLARETPPHAWGRPQKLDWREPGMGNTPTCVGKTSSRSPSLSLRRKHPHMRGEDRESAPLKGRLDGNTPTCVGKTFSLDVSELSDEKHPHMRGEDRIMFANTA